MPKHADPMTNTNRTPAPAKSDNEQQDTVRLILAPRPSITYSVTRSGETCIGGRVLPHKGAE